VKDAVNIGAFNLNRGPENQYDANMYPVIVKDMKKDMDLYHTESFSPAVSIMAIKMER
jgi:acyl-CoA reductase-like NAD-dependent aldehyde dehydrogenase